jgi:hypothetical protein
MVLKNPAAQGRKVLKNLRSEGAMVLKNPVQWGA